MSSGRALEVQHFKWTSFWLHSHFHKCALDISIEKGIRSKVKCRSNAHFPPIWVVPCLVAARAVCWRPRLAGTRQYICIVESRGRCSFLAVDQWLSQESVPGFCSISIKTGLAQTFGLNSTRIIGDLKNHM